MSGFVPRRVSMTRTASATTDIKAASFNNHIISTIGRRSTLSHSIKTRAFGSMLQVDYANGDKCDKEYLAPVRTIGTFVIEKDKTYNLEMSYDGFTAGFVKKSLKNELVSKISNSGHTDKTCGFGAINNYAENIILPTDLKTLPIDNGLLNQDTNGLFGSITSGTTEAATAGTYSNVSLTTTSGSGSGAQVEVITSVTAVTSVTVTTSGTGYSNGSVLTIPFNLIGRTVTDLVITLVDNDLSKTRYNSPLAGKEILSIEKWSTNPPVNSVRGWTLYDNDTPLVELGPGLGETNGPNPSSSGDYGHTVVMAVAANGFTDPTGNNANWTTAVTRLPVVGGTSTTDASFGGSNATPSTGIFETPIYKAMGAPKLKINNVLYTPKGAISPNNYHNLTTYGLGSPLKKLNSLFLSITSGGSAAATAGTYFVFLYPVSGNSNGGGAKAVVVTSATAVTSVTITHVGSGYSLGDQLKIKFDHIGRTGTDLVFQLQAADVGTSATVPFTLIVYGGPNTQQVLGDQVLNDMFSPLSVSMNPAGINFAVADP